MTEQERFHRYLARNPHLHNPAFFERPHWTRRRFFEACGAGLTGFFLDPARAAEVTGLKATPQGTARNCIFILLAGAPSHIDTFDFKNVAGVTPADFAPESVNGIGMFPIGLFPKLKNSLGDLAIVRSVRAWAAVHGLAQTWVQIGRNPTAALGDIAPNIGSIVAIEKEAERQPNQVFPTFLALNSAGAIAQGYLPAKYAPFKAAPSTAGLRNMSSTAMGGPGVFNDRYNLLRLLDDSVRLRSPYGRKIEDLDGFYSAARLVIDNPAMNRAFSYTPADAARYGNNAFGNSCLVAKQVLAANQGTRYIQLTLGGWDNHQNIYVANQGIYRQARLLDDALAALLGDLKSSGLLNETLVVVMGEFGRTVGRLTADLGRDHFLQQFVLFAGGGVKGGRVIGATDAEGRFTADPGWSRGRDIRPEDVEATIYSSLGIDWTKTRWDDPLGRGFEYVPKAKDDVYGPINELWA